jgi:uncharacterized zinc-type alcohol dehydrogenase-like protein
MSIAHGYAAHSHGTPMAPITFERRAPRPNDVSVEILFSGVCHSDIHTAHGEWDGLIYPDGTQFPCVPGHEIVGRVTAVGPDVSRYKVGDIVGVGTMVDSCRECEACLSGNEPYCEKWATWTYNAPDRVSGDNTLGGYADHIVVREEFVFAIKHDTKDLAAVAPLLCAGITMWSPLRFWNIGKGSKVGIVGIGGLGHMGIKLAHALKLPPLPPPSPSAKKQKNSVPTGWWSRATQTRWLLLPTASTSSSTRSRFRTVSMRFSACSSVVARWHSSGFRPSRTRHRRWPASLVFAVRCQVHSLVA